MIERGSTDYYKFYVSDKDALKVGIILHSHVGDADLVVSRKFEDPKLDNDPVGNFNFNKSKFISW
jgi:hypothetical protein